MTIFEVIDGDFTINERTWPRKYPWVSGGIVTSDTFTRPVNTGYLTDAALGGGRWPYLSVEGATVENGKLRAARETSIALELLPFDCKVEVAIDHRPAATISMRMWANYLQSKARLDYIIRQSDSRISQTIDGTTTIRASGLPRVSDGTTVTLLFTGQTLSVLHDGQTVGEATASPAYSFERRVFEIYTAGAEADDFTISSIKVTAI